MNGMKMLKETRNIKHNNNKKYKLHRKEYRFKNVVPLNLVFIYIYRLQSLHWVIWMVLLQEKLKIKNILAWLIRYIFVSHFSLRALDTFKSVQKCAWIFISVVIHHITLSQGLYWTVCLTYSLKIVTYVTGNNNEMEKITQTQTHIHKIIIRENCQKGLS